MAIASGSLIHACASCSWLSSFFINTHRMAAHRRLDFDQQDSLLDSWFMLLPHHLLILTFMDGSVVTDV